MIERPITSANLLQKRRLVRGWAASISAWAFPISMAAFSSGVIYAIHRISPRTLVSFHGFLHIAVADQFLKPGPAVFPPENPFYAGEPLPYYWFFQFLGAKIGRLLGSNSLLGMESLILAAAAVLVLTGFALGRSLYRSMLAGGLISFLILAGANPFGFLIAGIKVLRSGGAALQDDPNFLWGVVHPMYSLIRYKDHGGLYGPIVNFFLNLTSRPVALAALLVMVFLVKRVYDRPRLSSLFLLGLAAAVTAAFSPIIAIPASGALLAGLGITELLNLPRLRRMLPGWSQPLFSTGTRNVKRFVGASLAIAGGIAAALPTYYHLLIGPSKSQIYWDLFSSSGFQRVAILIIAGLPLVIIAGLGLVRRRGQTHPVLPALFIAALFLLMANLPVSIPPGNESNFFHAAVVLLSVPAAAFILKKEAGNSAVSGSKAAGIVLVCLPTTLLLLSAYLWRPPLPLIFKGEQLIRQPETDHLSKAYEWVRSQTPLNSIFVLDPRSPITVVGNTSEFPALTHRVLLTENGQHYLVGPNPDASRRLQLAVNLIEGRTLSVNDLEYLRRFERPIFILAQQEAGDSTTWRLQNRYGAPAFKAGPISIFSLQPGN